MIRHGKSDWSDGRLRDIERPLAPRGTRNAADMAHWIAQKGLQPDLILSSPALRARDTARIMAESWGMDTDRVQIREALYLAEPIEIAGVIALTDPETTSLAVFGHNPGFTHFVSAFMDEPLDNLPTAGLVALRLDCEDWEDLDTARILSYQVVLPRKHL